jgi:hypothetical protein
MGMAKIERTILKNPFRVDHPREMTEIEQEVETMAEAGTPQTRTAYTPVVYEYWAPFNYANFCVELGRTDPYVGAEFNTDGVELDVPPYGAITFVEEEPIVGVDVIGSACVPPGFVLLFAEPLEWKYPRSGVKMRIDGLWGKHIRIEPWRKGIDEGYLDAGMSCASFKVPEAKKITLMAGSQMIMDQSDFVNGRHDAHHCVRIIRVTVKRPV